MREVFAAMLEKPLSVRFQSQEVGEDLLMLVRQHWFTQVGRVITIIFLALIPLAFWRLIPQLTPYIPGRFLTFGVIFWLLFVFAFALESFINWYFNVLIITKKRILDVNFWGLLNKNVSETEISHLEDCTYTQTGVTQSLFNYGGISMQTAAEEREFVFSSAPNPAHVHDLITDLMAGSGSGSEAGENTPAPSSATV